MERVKQHFNAVEDMNKSLAPAKPGQVIAAAASMAAAQVEPLSATSLKQQGIASSRRAWEDWLRQMLMLSPIFASFRSRHDVLLPPQLIAPPTAVNNPTLTVTGILWPALLPAIVGTGQQSKADRVKQAHELIAAQLRCSSPCKVTTNGAKCLRATMQNNLLQQQGINTEDGHLQWPWTRVKVCSGYLSRVIWIHGRHNQKLSLVTLSWLVSIVHFAHMM